MDQQSTGIKLLLEQLGVVGRDPSVLAIGIASDELRGISAAKAYDRLSGPGELPASLRVQLGIVRAPLSFMARKDAEQLLSRLRDVHCETVLLMDPGGSWPQEELRSLGYLEIGCPSEEGPCYVFDPDLFNEPREWNNASHWANPENFKKYRW
jgi:hypothetical protein